MHKKHIHIAVILFICLFVAAGTIIFIKGNELKGLIAKPAPESEKVCDELVFNTSENGAINIYGSLPCFGTRVEQKITDNAVIARFKILNNSASAIGPIKNIEIKNSGFNSSADIKYALLLSAEDSANESANFDINSSAEKIAVSNTNSLNFTSLDKEFTISPGAYRYLSVAVESSAGLAQGDIFCLKLISLGDLKMKNTPVLGCVIKK